MEEREIGGMLPRNSLVPRKTFMGNLRSLASALPQVAEDGMSDRGLGKQLHGVRSYAPGSAAALSPTRDSSKQLVEVSSQASVRLLILGLCSTTAPALSSCVHPPFNHPPYWLGQPCLTCPGLLQVHSSAILQALRARDSVHPGGTATLAVQPGIPSRSSFLPGRTSALRDSQGSAAPDGFLSRGSFAQQQGSSAGRQPAELGSRASLALSHQRNVDMAARRAAGHSTQKLSSMTSIKAVPTPDALSDQWRPGSMFKEGADADVPAAADGPAAASPFLSVVLPAKE